MSKENLKIIYRQFIVFPFKEFGVVERKDGKSKEFNDSNGYRIIKDSKGNWHPVSHIIYAAGCRINCGRVRSYVEMKNFTISYKDKNKVNCNFDNLICKLKKITSEEIKIKLEKFTNRYKWNGPDYIWRQIIKNKSNKTCEVCGVQKSLSMLHAHHLYSYSEYPQYRIDPQNGVCLCKNCHINLFHKLYGLTTTPEQFYEFKINYRMGKYD